MTMSVKVKEKIAILEANGCKLLQSSQYPKTCNSKVDILCNCGHTRNSVLSNIILHEQFKCKTCIKIKKSVCMRKRKSEYSDKFGKIRISFENKFNKSNKYRDDFSPENIDKTLKCRECKTDKPLYRFYNRRGFKGGKEKLCRLCENKMKVERREHQTPKQIITSLLTACKANATERKTNGRLSCGECSITQDIVWDIYHKQLGKCIYSNKELTFNYNDMNKISIDRIDSSKGYTRENIQLVSKYVNWMKLDTKENEFLYMISSITRHSIENSKYDSHEYMIDSSRITKMIKICHASASKRKWERCRPECGIVNIDKKYIIDLIKQQNNCCVYSGIEFDWNEFKNNPYQASIDRIDNDKGYIKGNVQIVCNAINQMKSNLTDDEFMDYVSAIYEHRCINN
jgi:hypothetical protein